jgi:hypothetical protein
MVRQRRQREGVADWLDERYHPRRRRGERVEHIVANPWLYAVGKTEIALRRRRTIGK